MKERISPEEGLPFYTLSHGIYNDIYRHYGCLLIFERPLNPEEQSLIAEGIPWPLRERLWSDSLLYLGSEDWIDADLRIAYHPESAEELASLGYTLDDFAGPERYNILVQLSEIEATHEDKQAFSTEFQNWLLRANSIAPLLLMYATDPLPTERFKANQKRCLRDFVTRILPRLQQIWGARELDRVPNKHILASIFDNTCAALIGSFLQAHPKHATTFQEPLIQLLETIVVASPKLPQQRWIAQLHGNLLQNQPVSFQPPPLISA
ncbi:MAG: hypothetical protein H6728_13055 [Myxococcales bacterium]|nr:hypothetical protein [Myxococcales bacterium]MCB9643997.1 hypothetical protein [Myxococcales bacterium]